MSACSSVTSRSAIATSRRIELFLSYKLLDLSYTLCWKKIRVSPKIWELLTERLSRTLDSEKFCYCTSTVASAVNLVRLMNVASLSQRASTFVYNTMYATRGVAGLCQIWLMLTIVRVYKLYFIISWGLLTRLLTVDACNNSSLCVVDALQMSAMTMTNNTLRYRQTKLRRYRDPTLTSLMSGSWRYIQQWVRGRSLPVNGDD